ncbi:hypothetical protein VNI00_003791 [Paramarasmius palmivorus]|uniref:DUF6699 domain-containing protein n=1 Tax=Paramarasmius palmivorus TaxID=297713 RepID=A0AAW0DKH2_9AGAR
MNLPWGNYFQQPPTYYPHPSHVYYPPGWSQPQMDPLMQRRAPAPLHSKKYPNMHPILAADSTILRYDIRKKPQVDILSSTYLAHRHTPAMAYPATHIRLISKSFPWTIDIVTPSPITCDNVWEALHNALQQHLADSEWGVAVGDADLKKKIEKAAKKRGETDGDKALKRIDWLGDATKFKGLEKIEEFEKERLLPGQQPVAETWVVKLSE